MEFEYFKLINIQLYTAVLYTSMYSSILNLVINIQSVARGPYRYSAVSNVPKISTSCVYADLEYYAKNVLFEGSVGTHRPYGAQKAKWQIFTGGGS